MEKERKALFTIQIPPDKADVNVALDGSIQEAGFERFLTKTEFNHYLITNLDQVGQIMAAIIKKVAELEGEVNKLREQKNAKD